MNSPDLTARYLDLLEKSLLDGIYGESRIEIRLRALWQRLRHPYATRRFPLLVPARAHTAIGPTRLRHLRNLVERTIKEDVPGDYIETGVWRGGACILMKGVLAAHGISDRQVYCADTFSGLPRPDPNFPADKRDLLYKFRELAVSVETVRRNFAAYDLLDENVVFLKGLFANTLPTLSDKTFALIRLDGDMYGSTMSALVNLYDRVSPSGFVVIDDYGGLRNCAKAVHDFLDRHGLQVKIQPIDESCVWWQKN